METRPPDRRTLSSQAKPSPSHVRSDSKNGGLHKNGDDDGDLLYVSGVKSCLSLDHHIVDGIIFIYLPSSWMDILDERQLYRK